MRRGWKRLADRAANVAFDEAERRQALAGALAEDAIQVVHEGSR